MYIIYNDFIEFLILNNESMGVLSTLNVDEVSIFRRLGYVIYNPQYYLILLLLGIVLLIVFVLIT